MGSLDSTLVAGNGNDSCDKLCKKFLISWLIHGDHG